MHSRLYTGILVTATRAGDIGPAWSVFIATAACLYLWWLGALLFALVVVWHWHIRQARVLVRLDEIMGGGRTAAGTATGGAMQPPKYAPQVRNRKGLLH